MFIHLTAEKRAASVKRGGLRRQRGYAHRPAGVFAMPVTRNFYVSHQWLRELKRRGEGPIVGIYFRVPDREQVAVGHYGRAHQQMSAAEALSLISSLESPEGFEVVIPRKIEAREIHRIRRLPQVVGWRYFPRSHGRVPCGCDFCQRGLYDAGKLRERYNASR
jgi:hypothetical protein